MKQLTLDDMIMVNECAVITIVELTKNGIPYTDASIKEILTLMLT
mgnify:CR=1 FL=1